MSGLCYAEHGMLGGFIWTKLDQLNVGETFQKGRIKVYSLEELCLTVQDLPVGKIWRHNQAGDLPTKDNVTVDQDELNQLVAANCNRSGFTYTHFDVLDDLHNRQTVKAANDNGFTVNLSGNSAEHADQLYDAKCGPVTVVLPHDQMTNLKTPKGRKVVVCPARVKEKVTCASCGLCARQRDFIIGFPALGSGRHKLNAANDNEPT